MSESLPTSPVLVERAIAELRERVAALEKIVAELTPKKKR